MAAAVIGIVEKNHVAWLDIPKSLLDGKRRPRQRTDMNRDVVGLSDQASVYVANRKRKITAGVEDLRIGGAKHGFAHFFYDRAQPVLNHGSRDRIDLDGHALLAADKEICLDWSGDLRQTEDDTSARAPDAAAMIASTSASVIGVDNAISPSPAARTPRLDKPWLKIACR